jgi:hypothetical protein
MPVLSCPCFNSPRRIVPSTVATPSLRRRQTDQPVLQFSATIKLRSRARLLCAAHKTTPQNPAPQAAPQSIAIAAVDPTPKLLRRALLSVVSLI